MIWHEYNSFSHVIFKQFQRNRSTIVEGIDRQLLKESIDNCRRNRSTIVEGIYMQF